ncbi:hypothetical protein C3747_91g83 [Trypanosoma cruzi]|uniref:Uncharacterized protein n=2 Tax=Trypanosoma cruzi TaxID=5693 RepID=Q4E111_TRYCC|nr:hypothetical protein, conserved [Trypanosoma cruzi]EAN98506.1 hypothetical protein, conserved [Trypanosoma cruzi]PWV08333.1 hypothetical protein C3747_91g83 [Trypanosoma cruzi]RNC45869.1 hypothetical protein TcCL_NonESM04294 [Trypanosoma cruzi]|eukprot:XP_820357.1 hypothetical protein [Trypanosoma cruzi strain CL Brener]
MQLCYGCRHAFPASSLEPCVFSDIISDRFDEIHKIVKEMNTKTPEENHRVAKLQMALRELHSAVHQEISALKEQKAKLEASRQRDRQEMDLGNQSRLANLQDTNAMLNTQTMGTNLSRSNFVKSTPRATFNGMVPTYKLRKMNSALELVSAIIYSVVESLAIRTRAAVAMLWLPPPGVVSTELVAPFVVGRDMSKLWNSAPYRVSENSVPCLVSETGIAVNLKPSQGISDSKLPENVPIMELVEMKNTAQLIVPVYTRYGAIQRSVLAVLHLIGDPVFPYPFGLRNEEMAVQTAATLSVILSSYYETMGGEWANRIYDPLLLVSSSAYHGGLDMRSMEKCIDDFAPPATLIYRCKNDKKDDDDAREVIKTLRYAMMKRAVSRKAVWSVKDLHRFATNMEQNWISVLNTNAEMELKMIGLEEKALRGGLEKGQPRPLSRQDIASHTISDTSAAGRPVSSSAISVCALPPMFDKSKPLKPEQVTEIEANALQRLQKMGVDTAPFVMPKEAEDVDCV